MGERGFRTDRGFSLVEVLIASAIGSAILAIVFSLFQVAQNMWVRAEARVDFQQNARVAMGRILSEVRVATEILEAQPSRLRFRGDVTGDGVLREITYSFDAEESMIRRSEGRVGARSSGLQPLAHQIIVPAPHPTQPRPLFVYYDRDATEFPQPLGNWELLRIHWIAVTFASGEVQGGGKGPVYVLASRIHPRNLGLSGRIP